MPRHRLCLEVPYEVDEREFLVSVTCDYSPPRRSFCGDPIDPPDPGEVDWWLTGCSVDGVAVAHPEMLVLTTLLEGSEDFAERVGEAARDESDL